MLLKIFRPTLFLLLLPAQFPIAVVAQQAAEQAPIETAQEIPFELVNGYLLSVRGSVGTHQNLQFLVDFGTTYTMVDRRLMDEDEAGRSGEGWDVTHFANSIHSTDRVVSEFAVGSMVMKNFHVLAVDLTDIPTMPANISGVIGMDILQLHNLTIDFAEQKLFFSSSMSGQHQAPLETCLVGLAVNAAWKGAPVKLIISTGVDVVTLDQDRIKQGSYKTPKLKRGVVSSNFTVTPVAVFETKGMVLNDTGLRGPGLLRKMQWPAASDHLDGFLPLKALGSNRVSLDFERHLLLWDDPQPPTQLAKGLRNSFSAPEKKR